MSTRTGSASWGGATAGTSPRCCCSANSIRSKWRGDGSRLEPVPAFYKGPGYQWQFSTQKEVQGLPHEKKALYIERSPLYQVEKLKVPILVHVATNDTDVDYVEDQQLVWKLRALKPDLAETKVYVDPAPGPSSVGHTFNRRVNQRGNVTLTRPIDSWNRTGHSSTGGCGRTNRSKADVFEAVES
jgi:dienelactone hydrolase